MDWQEGNCHLQEVLKTLRKQGFCSGEDRNRTIDGIAGKTRHLLSRGANSGALIKVFDNTGLSRTQIAEPDLAFTIEAWPLLGPQAKNQMIAIARAAGQDGYDL